MTSARHRAAVEDGIVGTLDAGHEQPIVLAVRTANTNSNGHGVADQVTHTLDGANGQAVVVIDRASFNQGKNAQYPPHIEETQVMDTLVARGPHAVCYRTDRK